MANIMQTERNRLQKETEGYSTDTLCRSLARKIRTINHTPAQMTGAKSAAALPPRAEVRIRSIENCRRKLCEIGRCALARPARPPAPRFLRPRRGVVTRESQFITAFRDRRMSCGLLPEAKYSHRAAGIVDRPTGQPAGQPASQPELLRDNI